MPYIFFTDNKSEPKKLNVLNVNQDYDSESLNDFFACTKAPVHPIVAANQMRLVGLMMKLHSTE